MFLHLSVHADPVREIHHLLSRGGTAADGQVREIMVSHPTDAVLIAGAEWICTHRAYMGPSASFLEYWTPRSPALQAYFENRLGSGISEVVSIADRMLEKAVQQDEALHTRVLEVAARDRNVQRSLDPSDPRDRRLMFQHPLMLHWALPKLATQIRSSPEVLPFFLDQLQIQRSSVIVRKLVDAVEYHVPHIPELQETLLEVVEGKTSAATPGRVQVASTLLRAFPSHPRVLKVVPDLLQDILWNASDLALTHETGLDFIDDLRNYRRRFPAIDAVLEDSFEAFMGEISRANYRSDPVPIIWLYIDYLNSGRAPQVMSRFRRLMNSIDKEDRLNIEVGLLQLHDRLIPEFKALLPEFVNTLTSYDIATRMTYHREMSPYIVEIAKRDLKSNRGFDVFNLIKEMSVPEPQYLPLLIAETQRGGHSAKTARNVLALFDVTLPEALSPEIADLEVSEFAFVESIWNSDTPPRGWKKIVELIGGLHSWDYFGFGVSVHRLTQERIRRGLGVRRQALLEAESELRSSGLVTHPAKWVLQRLLERDRSHKETRPQKLTPKQVLEIEVLATSRLRQMYPHLSAETLSQAPYRSLHQRFVLEAEWDIEQRVSSAESTSFEQWRENLTRELDRKFRRGLRLILESGAGTILVEDHLTGKRYQLQRGDIADLDFRSIELKFLGNSAPRYGNIEGGEVAALTLGDAKTSHQVAKEVFIKRIFDRWQHSFKITLDLLKSEDQLDSLIQTSKDRAFQENFRIEQDVFAYGYMKALVGILWDPIDQNPNHWREREARALDEGREIWWTSVDAPGRKESDEFDRRSSLPSAKFTSRSERPKPGNIEITRELQETVIFRVEEKLPGTAPDYFLESFWSEAKHILTLPEVPARRGDADLVLYTERVGVVNAARRVSLPRPFTQEGFHDLQFLQVYSEDGTSLRSGRDYEVIEDQDRRALAIRVLKSGVKEVRYSAGFSAPESHKKPLPGLRVEIARIANLRSALHEAGFDRLVTELDALIKRNPRTVKVHVLADIFRRSAVYATSFETQLGTLPEGRKPTPGNPFIDFIRFLDPEGRLCAQCTGTNEFFAEFLRNALDPKLGIRVETVSVDVRNDHVIPLLGHQITFVWLPGSDIPLQLDVTPTGGTSGARPSPTLWERVRRFFGEEDAREWDATQEQRSLPEWSQLLREQVNEAKEVHSIPAREKSKVQEVESFVPLQNAYSALLKSVQGFKRSLDPSEPLARAALLSRVAIELMRGRLTEAQAKEQLEKVPLPQDENILRAIGEYAREQSETLDRYLKKGGSSKYPHYQSQTLVAEIKTVYFELEKVGLRAHPSLLNPACAGAWVK